MRWRAVNTQWTHHNSETNGPFPVLPKPVMGAATSSPHATTFASMEGIVGTMKLRRTYNPGWTADFMNTVASSDVAANRWSIYSFKLPPAQVASGTHDAAINSFLMTIPNGHKTTLVLWHEPEDDIINGSYTAAQWRGAQTKLGTLVHATGRAELTVGICLMSYSFLAASGRNPDNYWDNATFGSAIDYIGIDAYQPYGFLGGTTWENWSVSANHFTPWCQAKGKPIILMEYASAEYPGVPTRKATWLRDVYLWAQQTGSPGLAYFNLADGVGMSASHLIDSSVESSQEFTYENADSKT